jgi:hypothetical protein
MSYPVLQDWFRLFKETCEEYGISNEDIYNIDKKGFMKRIINNLIKVIILRHEAKSFSIQPGNRDWVSVIKCISINGYVLPPFVIFEGQRIQQT